MNGIERFSKEKCDVLIQLGNLLDSSEISSNKGMECLRLSANLKKSLGKNYIQLLGNKDIAYFYDDNRGLITPAYSAQKYNSYHMFMKDNKHVYQFAHQIKNYLFTHAGVSVNWYIKHYHKLKIWANHIGLDMDNVKNMSTLLNAVGETCDYSVLFNCGKASNGAHIYSGPLWADKSELIESPFKGLNQVVGHNKQDCISTHYVDKQTSITFTDCLSVKNHYLIVNID
jgi:hypothetical protein